MLRTKTNLFLTIKLDAGLPPLQTRCNNRKPYFNRIRRIRSHRTGSESPRSPKRAETAWTHSGAVGWVSWSARSRYRWYYFTRTFEVSRRDPVLWLIRCTFFFCLKKFMVWCQLHVYRKLSDRHLHMTGFSIDQALPNFTMNICVRANKGNVTYIQMLLSSTSLYTNWLLTQKNRHIKTCKTVGRYIKRREATLITHLGNHEVIASDNLGKMQSR